MFAEFIQISPYVFLFPISENDADKDEADPKKRCPHAACSDEKIHRILSFHGVAVCIRAENKTIIKVSCCFFKYFCLCVDYSSINMLLFQHIFGQKLSR